MWTRKGSRSTQRTRTFWKAKKSWLISENAKHWRSSWDCVSVSYIWWTFLCCSADSSTAFHWLQTRSQDLIIWLKSKYWRTIELHEIPLNNFQECDQKILLSILLPLGMYCSSACAAERRGQLVWVITKWPGEERFSCCWTFRKDPPLESFQE